MKKKLLIMVLTTLLYGSCNQESVVAQPYPTTSNIVKLTDKNMPAVEYFSVKKINLPEEYAHAEYHVYNDSIVIIVNNKYPDPYFVTLYNLNTKKEIAGYFKKGNGPDELISASGKMYRNYLVVEDGSAHAITRLNIDSVFIEKEAYKPTIVRLSDLTMNGIFITNNVITFPNPMYINDGYGVEGLPEFVQYDVTTGVPLGDYKHNNKNFPANLTQRTIAYCNSKYIAFWYCFPIVTIYDKDFNLLKMYRDDKYKDPKIIKIESELLSDDISDFFLFGCQTNNFIFATNGRGLLLKSDVKRKGGLKWINTPDFDLTRFKNQEIWCFDNNMNLARRFKCVNTLGFISNTSYNEKSQKLFITASDEEDEYCLYECIFKK